MKMIFESNIPKRRKQMKHIFIAIFFFIFKIPGISQTVDIGFSYTNNFSSSGKKTSHLEVGKQLFITIKGLGNAGKTVDVKVMDAVTKTPIHTFGGQVIAAALGGALQIKQNPCTLPEGMYFLQIDETAAPNTNIAVLQNDLLIIESRTVFNHGGMEFIIHHHSKAFRNHPLNVGHKNLFVANVEDIIKNVWDREVVDWKLSNGIAAIAGGNGADKPQDTDNKYHIIIHNISELCKVPITNVQIFNDDFVWAYPGDNDRRLYIDSHITSIFKSITNSASFEKEFLYQLISHEFYHGIQFSHVQYSSIPNQAIEIPKRWWLLEGQAKFLETVIMEPTAAYNYSNYSNAPSHINATYVEPYADHSYAYYTKPLMNKLYDNGVSYPTAYDFPKLHDVGYSYAVFWRHLFEHNFVSNTPLVDKLKLLRETCKANTSSALNIIESNIMDAELAAAAGNFNTFDKALIDFTEKLYFHDNAYNTAANRNILFSGIAPQPTKIWDDPNGNNFYSTITSFNEPVESLNNPGGTSFSKQYNITSSFGHRAHRFKFNRDAEIKIDFESNPGGANPGFGDFNVNCYLLNGTTIEQKQNIVLNAATGVGTINFNVDEPYKQIVILVTRLDANEGTANDYPNYKISLSEVAGTAGKKYCWPTPKKVTSKGLFFGGQNTVIGQFSDYRTVAGAKSFCQGIEIEASAVADERNVYALEAGTAFSNANSTNIGHFRYANLQNVVANGTNVKIGDKIGEIAAGGHMSFMESNTKLTSAGDVIPPPGKWINPLRNGSLSPYIDNADPVIQSINVVDANTGANIANPLYNKFDIIVEAYDPATTSTGAAHATLKCGIHKITVRFLDSNNAEIFHSDGSPTSIEYYPNFNKTTLAHELPTCNVSDVFHASASPGKFVYIVTNEPYDVTVNKYWNTCQKDKGAYNDDAKSQEEALFKDGEIKIEVTVEDLNGNSTTQTI